MYEFLYEHFIIIHNEGEVDNWAFIRPNEYVTNSQKYAKFEPLCEHQSKGLSINIERGRWYYSENQI